MKLAIDFVLVMGILSILGILFLLIKTKQKTQSHQLLIILLSLLFCVVLTSYALLHRIKSIYYICFLVYFSIGYIAGPLFYLYIKSIFQPEEGLLKKNWKHFIPAILILLFWNIPLLISHLKGAFVFSYLEKISEIGFVEEIDQLGQLSFFLAYGFVAYRNLKQYQQKVKSNYSNLSDKNVVWVEYFLIGSLIAMIGSGILHVLQLQFGENNWTADYLIALPLVGMVLYLGYHGLTQSQVLLPSFLLEPATEVTDSTKVKLPSTQHSLSNVAEPEIQALKKSLLETIETEQLYLNEELTLGMLADSIGTTDKKMSVLLNHYLNTSFYDFINAYRVAEVQQKIKDKQYDHYTLLAIGLESGFKSKASFNRVFKKVTGLSPSKYKSTIQNREVS